MPGGPPVDMVSERVAASGPVRKMDATGDEPRAIGNREACKLLDDDVALRTATRTGDPGDVRRGPRSVRNTVPSRLREAANTKGSDSRSPDVPDYSGRGERIRTSDLLVQNDPEGESPKVSPDPSPSPDKKKPDDETR